MAKKIQQFEFNTPLALGGIAAGHIMLTPDGCILGKADAFFVIKAERDGELVDIRLLQSKKSENIPLSCFEKASAYCHFPFVDIVFSDSTFPAEVKMHTFSPFIPHNDTDSGIPAVYFEFEITCKDSERVDFSVCAVTSNLSENAHNRMGCTDSGEAYIFLSSFHTHTNSCIATNGKNVSFCEYVKSNEGLVKNLTQNQTLYNKTKTECPTAFAKGALCTHFGLCDGETQFVSFCLSWYSQESDFSRNYYSQYFESSLECASYFFRQYERLNLYTEEFSDCVFSSTLKESLLYDVNSELFSLFENDYTRLDDGTLIAKEEPHFSDIYSFVMRQSALPSLFPKLDNTGTVRLFESEAYERASQTELAFAILKSHRKYALCANTDELIEEWYCIVKCARELFGENFENKPNLSDNVIFGIVNALADMASAVKDKKRYDFYCAKIKENEKKIDSSKQFFGFSAVSEICAFDYDAVQKHISFCPDSHDCPLDFGETFRCFFCTPTCYGYVEEGIDYIEINLVRGELTLRSFGAPRMPRIVQYGGRNWKFECKDKTAFLDSDIVVTPDKKITILIDIKQ